MGPVKVSSSYKPDSSTDCANLKGIGIVSRRRKSFRRKKSDVHVDVGKLTGLPCIARPPVANSHSQPPEISMNSYCTTFFTSADFKCVISSFAYGSVDNEFRIRHQLIQRKIRVDDAQPLVDIWLRNNYLNPSENEPLYQGVYNSFVWAAHGGYSRVLEISEVFADGVEHTRQVGCGLAFHLDFFGIIDSLLLENNPKYVPEMNILLDLIRPKLHYLMNVFQTDSRVFFISMPMIDIFWTNDPLSIDLGYEILFSGLMETAKLNGFQTCLFIAKDGKEIFTALKFGFVPLTSLTLDENVILFLMVCSIQTNQLVLTDS